VRQDFGQGPHRTWAAFGVQGLAPYWFDVDATAYVGDAGRTALRIEADYDLSLTQRLILQPRFELNAYGKDDPAANIGSGISDAEFGVRLRYEIRREFAPYIGVERVQRFGRTEDFVRDDGKSAGDTQWVVGLRIWY
jgi:copper resistance protein B